MPSVENRRKPIHLLADEEPGPPIGDACYRLPDPPSGKAYLVWENGQLGWELA